MTRVLKKNRETAVLQKSIMESATRKNRRKTADKPSKKSKRGNNPEEGVEAEEEYLSRLDVRLNIPDDLKHKLVEDWEKINKSHKVRALGGDRTRTRASFLAPAAASAAPLAPLTHPCPGLASSCSSCRASRPCLRLWTTTPRRLRARRASSTLWARWPQASR